MTSQFQPPRSLSGNSRSRLKPRTLLFRYFAEINLILGAWYLQWRLLHTVNANVLWLAIPLAMAEIYSYFGGVMFTIGLWRPLEREVRSLDQLKPAMSEADYPTVDVFVTCYNEPVDIIEQTTQAALELDYPADKLRVYVLDDGNSAAVQQMTQRLGAHDRHSERVQSLRKKLKAELLELMQRFDQLGELVPEVTHINHLLTQSEETNQADQILSLQFQKLWRIVVLVNPSDQDMAHQLQAERQKVMAAIAEKKQQLARLMRCQYIARPKPNDRPHHAKAGNINYALFSGQCSGEFLVTLDTDHVLQPHFLKRVLPYFYTYDLQTGQYGGNRVAFVQTPQDFKNLPPGDPFGHHARLFYGPIQQGKDGLNSAFYTGTNAVLRREAVISVGIKQFSKEFVKDERRLEEFDLVGAMSTDSITEDMNTAMRLHADGWQSIYHNELMAYGLAPNDLSSTLKQRLRWAQGTIQVLLRENPLTMSGLSFWQRLQYFQTMYSYFSGFATLIYLICPIIFFFTGVSPVSTQGLSFAIHFFPAFILNRVTFITATWGIPAREIWRCEQYAIALFPLYIRAVISVFTKRSLQFQVTPKQRQAGVYLRLILPQLIIFGLTILGLLWSVYQFMMNSLPYPFISGLNGMWGIYNLALLWSVIRASVWQPQPATVAKAKAALMPRVKVLR